MQAILDIYIPRAFQWYKELFNLMNFDLYNRPLKIWESIGTLTPKLGVHLGVWGFIPSHSLALPKAWNLTPRLHFWPALSQALALVRSPRLGLWHPLWWTFLPTKVVSISIVFPDFKYKPPNFVYVEIGTSNRVLLHHLQYNLLPLPNQLTHWEVEHA